MQVFCISALAVFVAGLYLRFLHVTRQIRVQQRRYPMFAVRDRLVRMKLEGKIPAELFEMTYRFCNQAMCVSDEVDLVHVLLEMKKAARVTKTNFTEKAVEYSKTNHEYGCLFAEIIGHVLRWSLANAIMRRPWELVMILSEGLAKRYVNDYRQLRNTRERVRHAAA